MGTAPGPPVDDVMLQVLHESGGVLAVAKPAGLPTQAPAGVPSAEAVVRASLFGTAAVAAPARRHPGGFLGVPHRLDRAVSGVLLLATTPRAARQLSRQFERRQIDKRYLALLHPAAGVDPLPTGTAQRWRDSLRKVADEPRAEIVAAELGREAVTDVTLLGAADGLVAAALAPLTGRMHQLRVQAASRGLPVAGDELYGASPWPVPTDGDPRSRPIALHAASIAFIDPETAGRVRVDCPVPSPWHNAFPEATALAEAAR